MTIDSQTIGIKSLRIFFSYSSEDKYIVGDLKKYLELAGFEVFLAHEDIQPCIEWQEEIQKNLIRCDIFIPLFTQNFKKSNWTDQEIGIAIASDKFIIPLHTDITPYGFVAKIQSLKLNDTCLDISARGIINAIKNKSKFGEDMKTFVINALVISGSFEEAKIRAKLLEDFDNFTPEQVQLLYDATIENSQINQSFGAQPVLIKFFEKYKNSLEAEKYEKIISAITN